MLETDGQGNQTAKNIYGANLLARTAGSDTLYYMYNGHADVTALLNSNGAIAGTYYYDAFGNITEQTGNVNNNITYAGYQYDKESGLYYLNARMYDPKIARFLQEDTYRGQANDPLSLNLYTYCHNEPIMYTDPTGHTEAVDINLSKTDQDRIGKLTNAYISAKARGDNQAAEDAHRAAVAIRQTGGLSNYKDAYNYSTSKHRGGSGNYSKGSSGEIVTSIQYKLQDSGYSVGSSGADGQFGLRTEGAAIRYQIDKSLYYDGIVGKNTGKSLGLVAFGGGNAEYNYNLYNIPAYYPKRVLLQGVVLLIHLWRLILIRGRAML